MPVADLAERSGGVPQRAHRLAADWARAEAARRLGRGADRTAAERSGLRRAEQRARGHRRRAAGGCASAPSARDAEPATTVCPYKGLAPFDGGGRGVLLRARAPGRRDGGAARRRAAAGGRGPVGQRQVLRPARRAAGRAGRRRPAGQRGLGTGAAAPRRAPAAERSSARPPRRRRTGRLLVAVDQFEEVFTLCRDEAERAAFVDALVGSAGGSGSVVVLAVRADFYGRCAAYPELARLLGANHVLVGPMQRDELRRAIELPAQRAGLRVEPELVERLLADVEDEPGALPLLSTALFELWQRRDGRRLRLAAYERTGGVRGAVARLAEAAYERLDRRAAGRRAIASCCASPARTPAAAPCGGASRSRSSTPTATTSARVLDVLAGSRLVLVDAGTAEVAHEALLREWPRLRGWLEEDAEGRRLHRHLAVAAREWDAGGRDPGELYRGARLASTLDWSAGHARRAQRARARVPRRERRARRARGAPRAARQPAPARPARRRRRAAGRSPASPACCSSTSAAPRATRRAPRWRSASARRRSSSTTSTARCCSRARASRSTTRCRRAATCSPR